MRNLKIIFSTLFVILISFFIVRACVHKHAIRHEIEKPHPIIKKKVIHRNVVLPEEEKAAQMPSETPIQGPRMAIILDDWGNNYSLLKSAIDIGRPITLSILPHLTNSARIAEEAYENNLGVMLHMPMQPKNKTRGLEPHTIMVTDPDSVVVEYLDSALESVPHADGVNNHMGSAATSDERVMRTVLSHLTAKNLFFIDSDTDSTTVAPKIAREVGIKFAKRNVFIDNVPDEEMIKNQLEKAKAYALRRGRVVVIGHDKKMTLDVIKSMVPEIEKAGIKLVLVKELVN